MEAAEARAIRGVIENSHIYGSRDYDLAWQISAQAIESLDERPSENAPQGQISESIAGQLRQAWGLFQKAKLTT